MVLRERILLATAILMLLIGSASATSPFTMNIASNTLYQNTNSMPLAIYSITHSAPLSAYLGTSSSNMLEVAYEDGGSVTISSIVYSLAGYNMSSYMLVQPNEYYKFNFTSANFIGQYGPSPASSTSQTLLLPEQGQSEYAGGALALFAVGLLMYIFLVLYAFTDIFQKLRDPKTNMLLIFITALTTVAVLVFSAFYQVQLSIPPYQVTSGGSTTTIAIQSSLTTPLAASSLFGPIITLLSITATLLGLVLPAYYFIESARRKRYRVS